MSDIDYHKLQQKLFEIDPRDPRQDLAALQQAAGKPDAPAPAQTVTESAPAPQELIDEVSQLAALAGATKKQSVAVSDEAADMAALAGITLNEGQKKGKSGQLKGQDRVGKSKSSRSGEQKNVTRGKLVGSTERDEESVAEGDKWDSFKQGFDNYNKLGGNKGTTSSKKSVPDTEQKQKQTSSKQLSPEVSKRLAPYNQALEKILADEKMRKEFEGLINRANKNAESIGESLQTSPSSKTTVNQGDKASIKEELMRRLNQHK